jgi:hypothetical protein
MGRKANWAARLRRAAAAGLRRLALHRVARAAACCCWAGLGRIASLGNKRFEHFGKDSNKWNSNFEFELQQPKTMHHHECHN